MADPGQPCTPPSWAELLRNALSCESTWPHRKSILTVDKSMLILVDEGVPVNVCRAVLRLCRPPLARRSCFCRPSRTSKIQFALVCATVPAANLKRLRFPTFVFAPASV